MAREPRNSIDISTSIKLIDIMQNLVELSLRHKCKLIGVVRGAIFLSVVQINLIASVEFLNC